MNTLLKVKSLTVAYAGEEDVVKNIELDIKHKEIIAIVGESGSGKTTLINAILNNLPATVNIKSGEIVFNGRDLRRCTKQEWQTIRGNDICMIFQNPGSFFNPIMKIGKQFIDRIRSHRKLSKAEAKEKALVTLTKMGFSEQDCQRIYHAYPFELSGGMKQRVAIAMALALEPKLILADEPTSALDVITQEQIVLELMKMRDLFDTSILMVTHNIAIAAYMADRMIVMRKGEILEFADTAQMLYQPQNAYTKSLLQAIPELKEVSS